MSSLQVVPQDQPALLTPAEVAKILKVSTNTVIRYFSTRDGVQILPDWNVSSRKKRDRYRQIRIPQPVLDKFLSEITYRDAQRKTRRVQ